MACKKSLVCFACFFLLLLGRHFANLVFHWSFSNIRLFVGISNCQCQYVSVRVNTCQYVSVSVNTCLYVSVSVSMCQLVSVCVRKCLKVSVSKCQYEYVSVFCTDALITYGIKSIGTQN